MALHIFIFGSSTGIGLRGGKTTRNYSEVLFLYEKKRAEGVTWIKVKEEIWLHNYPTQRGSLFWPAFRLRFLFPGVWLVFFLPSHWLASISYSIHSGLVVCVLDGGHLYIDDGSSSVNHPPPSHLLSNVQPVQKSRLHNTLRLASLVFPALPSAYVTTVLIGTPCAIGNNNFFFKFRHRRESKHFRQIFNWFVLNWIAACWFLGGKLIGERGNSQNDIRPKRN